MRVKADLKNEVLQEIQNRNSGHDLQALLRETAHLRSVAVYADLLPRMLIIFSGPRVHLRKELRGNQTTNAHWK